LYTAQFSSKEGGLINTNPVTDALLHARSWPESSDCCTLQKEVFQKYPQELAKAVDEYVQSKREDVGNLGQQMSKLLLEGRTLLSGKEGEEIK
jgi:hypothetical protein